MEVTYQSSVFNTVRRISNNQLISECLLLSTGYEALARIQASTITFVIEEANWEIYRSPGSGLNGAAAVPELIGAEAYFQSGGALNAVGAAHGDLPRELLAECVRGVIQAETYVFEDRGFPSAEVFEAAWTESYLGSCRLYSNFDQMGHTWFDYIENRKWGDSLFNRYKTVVIQSRPDGSTAVNCSFADSFHELGFSLTLAADKVQQVEGNFLRAPALICRENVEHLPKLVGQALPDLTKKNVGKLVGGPCGCSHMVDLLIHAVRTYQDSK